MLHNSCSDLNWFFRKMNLLESKDFYINSMFATPNLNFPSETALEKWTV